MEISVDSVAKTIYNEKMKADRFGKGQTYFAYALPFNDPFYKAHMPTILKTLSKLLPDCMVSHTLLTRGKDGRLYDISRIDDKLLPIVDNVLEQSYIFIEW